MYLTTIKYLQFLTGLILTGLFLASPGLIPALYPELTQVTPTADFYTQQPALLILLSTATANLLSGCYQNWLPGGRRPLQLLGALAIVTAGLLSTALAFGRLADNPALADLPLITVSLLAAGLVVTILCNLHCLNPGQKASGHPPLESGREGGIVKWFNVSKGFGFITRDSGEDIFVHYRAIRGEGHRILSEGQRVHFLVAEKEKGLQAEDVVASIR